MTRLPFPIAVLACQPRRVALARVFVTTLKRDAIQGSERDPEAIVQRLLQSERHLSAVARDEILALGAAAICAQCARWSFRSLPGWTGSVLAISPDSRKAFLFTGSAIVSVNLTAF